LVATVTLVVIAGGARAYVDYSLRHMQVDLSGLGDFASKLNAIAEATPTPLRAQDAKMDNPKPAFTGYPPAVYKHFFIACPGDKPCIRKENFHVDRVPKGCCVLTVTNGDGRGTDEVSSYEVFLNGRRVAPIGETRNAQAAVKVQQDNTLRVVLVGGPHSKVFILVGYDPRESK
jgi:hypothetical protein